jgi:hypothetical protein
LTPHSGACLPTLAEGSRRKKLVRRQSSVAVLVELLQGLAGLGDLVGVNDAVAIQVERRDDRRRG